MEFDFRDVNDTIYLALREEFYSLSYKKFGWHSFITYKDLGINCVNYYSNLYKIVDHKKWLLAKLKYGI